MIVLETPKYEPTQEDHEQFEEYIQEQTVKDYLQKRAEGDLVHYCDGVDVEPVVFVPYAFTLRKTTKNKHATEEIYLKRCEEINALGCDIMDLVFENEQGLHCHGIIDVPVSFKFKKLRLRGWNILLRPLTDPEGWKAYISKNQKLG